MLLNFIYVHTLTTDRTLCITTRTYTYLDNSTASATAMGTAQLLQSPSSLHGDTEPTKFILASFKHQPLFSCLLTNKEDKPATQLQLETGHKSRIQILVGRYTQTELSDPQFYGHIQNCHIQTSSYLQTVKPDAVQKLQT